MDQVLRQLTPFSSEGDETGMRRSVCYKQSQCLFNEVQCLFNEESRFKCTYRKVAIRELFSNERQKGGRENVSVFGGVHDPREDHKLDDSLLRYSSPHMDFQWMLMPILQLSGCLLPNVLPSVALQLDC